MHAYKMYDLYVQSDTIDLEWDSRYLVRNNIPYTLNMIFINRELFLIIPKADTLSNTQKEKIKEIGFDFGFAYNPKNRE